MMNRIPSHTHNSAVRREPDRRALIRLGVVFVCALLLTVGFVRAAAQHTAALEQGYRSEELRKERERLLSEQRRLMLALTIAQSPVELEPRARRLGLAPARSAQLELPPRAETPSPSFAASIPAASTMR